MALIDQYNLSQDQSLAFRVTAALSVALFTIETEDPTTPNHAARLTWVAGMRNDPGTLVAQLCAGLSAHPDVIAAYLGTQPLSANSVPDSLIQTTVTMFVNGAVGIV